MSVMRYKGYQARVDFDDNDGLFVGRLVGIDDLVSFHADTVDALRAAFREAVDDYIATCAAVGKPPEKPYSGKVLVRIPPDLHARAAHAAQLAGKSLNQWAEDAFRAASEGSGAGR